MPQNENQMNKLSVTMSPTFTSMIEEKVRELILANQKEGEIKLDENRKGTLMIYIDEKPTLVMFGFEVDGRKVYIGGNFEPKT